MTVDVAVFFTGKANGNLEYSSTIVRRNGLFLEGRGSLKSINMRSNDCVAFFSWTVILWLYLLTYTAFCILGYYLHFRVTPE